MEEEREAEEGRTQKKAKEGEKTAPCRRREGAERGRRAELNSGGAGEAARLNERAGDPLWPGL